MVFSLLWNTFESRIDLTLRNLQRHQTLIDNEVSAEEIEQSHIAREKALEQYEEGMRDKQTQRKKILFDWLQPPEMETAKDRSFELKTPGTNDWLLHSKEVENWFSGKHHAIWLTGKPGAGMFEAFRKSRWTVNWTSSGTG
jgi:DNA replication protein DnaC